MIGKPLRRKSIAWFWVAVFGLPAVYLAYRAATGTGSWLLPLILSGFSVLYVIEPFLRKRETETTELNDSGVVQVDGDIRTELPWSDVSEIGIVTTSDGPFAEDVFFVLSIAEKDGCVIPHETAERVGLLAELHARFPGLDDKKVIEAMGCTSDNQLVLWKRPITGN